MRINVRYLRATDLLRSPLYHLSKLQVLAVASEFPGSRVSTIGAHEVPAVIRWCDSTTTRDRPLGHGVSHSIGHGVGTGEASASMGSFT